MTVSIPFLTRFTQPLTCVLLLGTFSTALAQNRVSDEPADAACEREIRRLGGQRVGERSTAPTITRRVRPAYPQIPDRTTGGGVWIGRILIDTSGKVLNVWTVRDVKLEPPLPPLTKAITDAVLMWQFAPAAVDKVPVPICVTITVNVNLEAIRGGR